MIFGFCVVDQWHTERRQSDVDFWKQSFRFLTKGVEFNPEDGGGMFLQHVGVQPQDYMV
jgi:hypothetical protein